MKAYYNENDPRAAAWLRELIKEGKIANGDVDERSITEVAPNDLKEYGQCHFFAGIGGWSLALRLAGVPDDRPIWTGSCPCQPFSAAGKGGGVADERHLWPAFRWLIAQCGPAIVLGEQVASADGRDWLAGIRFDLEGMGYACGAADLCAAGAGAPHIRQRLFWVADAESAECQHPASSREWWHGAPGSRNLRGLADQLSDGRRSRRSANGKHDGAESHANVTTGRLADDNGDGCNQGRQGIATQRDDGTVRDGAVCGMGNADRAGLSEQRRAVAIQAEQLAAECGGESIDWNGRTTFWPCRDGYVRRVPAEPALFPLADGIPGRVGLLRGSGNAIVPEVAAEFVKASILISHNDEDYRDTSKS